MTLCAWQSNEAHREAVTSSLFDRSAVGIPFERKMALRPGLGRLNPSTTAFFLCDVQERFRSIISFMPSVIFVAQRMVAASRLFNIPVVVTEQNPSKLGKTVPEVDLSGIEAYPKTRFSMMIPQVEERLHAIKPRSIVLFGMEAHVCVQQTCLDLLAAGYEVTVLADGTSSHRNSDRIIAFERMRQAGAFISTSESVMFELQADSVGPTFKGMSNLAKANPPDTGLLSAVSDSNAEADAKL